MKKLLPFLLIGGAGAAAFAFFAGDELSAELKKMTGQQRQLFDRLMKVERDRAKVGAGAATFNAMGFPKASAALVGRAKSL